MPLISIITINYNNLYGLKKTVDSVIGQPYKDYEWIVIDGGSTDGSKELIQDNSDHINFWVSEPDNGIYNAMNKGINVSKGEYILFLNSGDVFYNNDSLSECSKFIGDSDFEIFDIIIDDGNKEFKKRLNGLLTSPILYFLIKDSFPHQSTIIKHSVFEKFGLYNEHFALVSDWELYIKAFLDDNTTFSYHPNSILSIYDGNGSSSINKELVATERQNVLDRLFSKNCLSALKQGIYQNNIDIQLKQNKIISLLYRLLLWLSNKL